jgi:dephospho-CoA kinase
MAGSFQVIGVTGLQGSGKTEVARIAAGLDIPCVRMGDVVWGEVKARGLELNELNVGSVADELRKKEGREVIARRAIPMIELAGKGKPAVLVDGIRSREEVNAFHRVFGDKFQLLAIVANERARYSRIAPRARVDDVKSFEEFKRRDERELGWGLGEVIPLADIRLRNEGSLEDFRREVSSLLKQLVGEMSGAPR